MATRMRNLRNDAVFAVEKADYASALIKLDAARIIYDTTPNAEKDGLRMEWRSIEPLIARIELLANRAAGHGKLKRVPVTHGNATGEALEGRLGDY